jgi:hypothetical protein
MCNAAMPGAQRVGPGFSPLDEELGLLPGPLTPTLQAHLSRLGARLSFAEAASELGHLKGVSVSAATARRRTEADGAVYAALQDAEATRVVVTAPQPPAGPPVQQLSVDGAMVPLVDGSWREVRTLAIGTVVPGRQPGTVRCEDLSYFSRLVDAATFTTLATGEVHRRGVETAGRVAGVVDGAEWCQSFVDVHRPDAVRILDFAHATQRLGDVAEAVWGSGEPGRTWATAQRAELREGTAEAVLAAIRALPLAGTSAAAEASRIQGEVLGYLEPRVDQMRYATFRAHGLPIGSGIVESANKLVVEARLKGAGQRWAEPHITPMVALRGAICSRRWEEAWAAIAVARRARRVQPASLAAPAAVASAASVAAPTRRPRQPPSPALPRTGRKTFVNGRPTANHPWKRRLAGQTTSCAKF